MLYDIYNNYVKMLFFTSFISNNNMEDKLELIFHSFLIKRNHFRQRAGAYLQESRTVVQAICADLRFVDDRIRSGTLSA